MKILVFIKQVPDTVDVKIDPVTKNLDRSNVKGVINPFDMNAIEAALQLKERHGATVVVISMGPPQTADSLKKALAMGCDEAVLLCARELGGADTLATGYTLACAVRKIGDADLLLFGRHAVDADTGQTGPIVAEFLGLPQVTFAEALEVEGEHALVDQMFEHCTRRIRVRLPAVVTVTKELNEPRYATPLNIMKAAKKSITVWNHEDLGCDPGRIGLKGSPSAVQGIFEPERHCSDVRMLSGSPEEIAGAIVDLLSASHLV